MDDEEVDIIYVSENVSENENLQAYRSISELQTSLSKLTFRIERLSGDETYIGRYYINFSNLKFIYFV